jgi:hypothetical protein
MAIKLADALLYLAVDDDGLKSGLRSAEGQTDNWAKAVSGRLNDVMRGGLERVGQMATNLVATGARAAGALVVDSIGAAGDLGETINKVSVVFDENSAKVLEWSKNTSTALGQSRQTALDAVGTFGNLFDSMGIGKDATTDMSLGLVELASDLASFNNLDPTEALEKLRSGIVGETEPLRSLGVNLNAVAVQAKAMQMGLVETTVDMTKVNRATLTLEKANTDAAAALKEHGAESLQYRDAQLKVAESEKALETAMAGKNVELTAAQKAQATYALILEQTKNAQGDFANTADGAANSSRILDAQLADMKATIGGAFLPVWGELLKAMNAVLKDAMPQIAAFMQDSLGPAILQLIEGVKSWVMWFMALDPATQGLIGKFAAAVAVLVPLLAILTPIIGAVSSLAGIFGAIIPVLGTVGGSLAVLLNPIALVLAAVIGLAAAWQGNWFGIRDVTNQVTSTMADTMRVWMADFTLGIQTGLTDIRGWWQAHDQDVQAIATDHWAGITALWTTQWDLLRGVTTAGIQFLTGDWDGGMQTLRDTAATLWDNVKGIFRTQLDLIQDLFTLFGWGDIGQAIVEGIGNGIRNAASFMADAAVDAAKHAFDAAAAWLEIGSPSKRAEDELGEPVGVGWGIGVAKGIKGQAAENIKGAMAGVFSDLSQGAKDGLANYLQSAVQYSGDYLNDWLMDVPEQLRDEAQSIGQYFAGIRNSGDWLNDWLTQIPESMRAVAQQAGQMLAEFGFHPDVVDEALRNVINQLTASVGTGSSGPLIPATATSSTPSTVAAGNSWTITINQNFYEPAEANVVKAASQAGIVDAMRAVGLR